jgi:hypothetical protein
MTQFAAPATPSDRPDLQTAFKRVLWEINVVISSRARPEGTSPMIPHVLILLIGARLNRLQRRFVALVGKALAGTLRPVRPRVRRAAPRDPAQPARAPDPLPRGAAWLSRLCPNVWYGRHRPIGGAMAALATFVEDERVGALLASDPRFGRLLRPLWRMLRSEPPPACLRLPPRPRRTRAPRPRLDMGLPLPKGVTRRDIARSRAMTPPPVPQPPPQPQPQCGTATDWTPSHLTRDRRSSVFDPIVLEPRRWRFAGG